MDFNLVSDFDNIMSSAYIGIEVTDDFIMIKESNPPTIGLRMGNSSWSTSNLNEHRLLISIIRSVLSKPHIPMVVTKDILDGDHDSYYSYNQFLHNEIRSQISRFLVPNLSGICAKYLVEGYQMSLSQITHDEIRESSDRTTLCDSVLKCMEEVLSCDNFLIGCVISLVNHMSSLFMYATVEISTTGQMSTVCTTTSHHNIIEYITFNNHLRIELNPDEPCSNIVSGCIMGAKDMIMTILSKPMNIIISRDINMTIRTPYILRYSLLSICGFSEGICSMIIELIYDHEIITNRRNGQGNSLLYIQDVVDVLSISDDMIKWSHDDSLESCCTWTGEIMNN